MGKFIVSKRNNGEYQFNLHADNGQVILTSEGYTTKSACTNGIESSPSKRMLQTMGSMTARHRPTTSTISI
jgi:uncharacterized protein YegP (UPF0339 family)